jgi:NAD-dependent DNA ligase
MPTPMETIEALHTNPKRILEKISVDDLVNALRLANEKYRNNDETLLTDALYDLAFEHLEKIAPNHPFLSDVGASVKGEKVKIPYWMGSLDKIKDDSKTIEKWKIAYPGEYVLSDKLDGNSGLLVIEPNGVNKLYSRGDGIHGQDLSGFLKHIKVPTMKTTCAVRGELIISKKNWEKIKDKGANARNVVAGALHASSPDKDIASKVDFVVYELIYPKMTPSDGLEYMKQAGFKVAFNKVVTDPSQVSLESLSYLFIERRVSSPYDIDGIVVMQDIEHKVIKEKNPKYGFAFKSIHTQQEAEVTVDSVEWNVSKDGLLKPTVTFPTVNIGGVKIQRATGFNAAFIETNVIGPGARIIIIRSGDVIPYIVRVTSPALRPAFPHDVEYEWNRTHIDIIITNRESKEMRLKALVHFAKSLDISSVGPGTIAKLYENGIDTIPKLLNVTAEEVLSMEGFQKVSAEKVVKSLQNVRETALCADLMKASNIFGHGLGKTKLDLIVKKMPEILTRKPVSIEQIITVDGIATKTATLFIEGLPKFFALMDELKIPCRTEKSKVKPKHDPIVVKETLKPTKKSLTNMQIIFTGFRNKLWEERITDSGGKIASGVSKKLNLVVAADVTDTSSKITKAIELGIPVISKEQFEEEYI